MPERECGTRELRPDGSAPPDVGCEGLYEAYHKQVRCYFAKRVRCPHDVDDLVQNVFTSLMAHHGPLQNPQLYVHFVARHQLFAYWRRRRRALPLVPILLGFRGDYDGGIVRCDPASNPLEQLFCRETAQIVNATIACLSPVLAEALRLRLLNGLELEEAAVKAGCSRETLKKRFQRARQSFMELCEEGKLEAGAQILHPPASNETPGH